MNTGRVRGAALKVGDTIEVWWAPKLATITKLTPYAGPLVHLFPEGASIATFSRATSGATPSMTIDHADLYILITGEHA